jgi:hypothetical protein
MFMNLSLGTTGGRFAWKLSSIRRCNRERQMPKPTTLRSITRTLARLKHVTKIEPNGPQTLAYVLVKNHWGRPSQLEHLTQFLTDTAARMRELTDGKHRCLECGASLAEFRRNKKRAPGGPDARSIAHRDRACRSRCDFSVSCCDVQYDALIVLVAWAGGVVDCDHLRHRNNRNVAFSCPSGASSDRRSPLLAP